MTDRKINRAALCIVMSLVLALSGCAAAAPATGQGSTGKEAAGQESTTQANAGQEAAGQETPGQEAAGASAGQEAATQETPGQETVGEEISSQTTVEEDEFDFEEGDPNTPAADGEMPSKFDLRDVQVKGSGIVPPIRFQNPFGTCWVHGPTAAAEISILGSGLAQDDGYTAETFNLSEKHLSFFAYTALNDPEDPQNGEGMRSSVPLTGSQKLQGGDPQYVTWLYASGIGPNLEDRSGLDEGDEEVLAYKGRNEETESRPVTWYDENGEKHSGWRRFCYSSDDDWEIPEKYRFYQSYRLKDSYILPSPAKYEKGNDYSYNPNGTAAIKQQLLAYRGVSFCINAESSRPDWTTKKWKYLSPNWAQYTYDSVFDNSHSVCIVGWDDDYPKENFNEGHQPPENGAFLARNSWGSDYNEFPTNGYRHWGIEQEENKHNGYFWVSYYDKALQNFEALSFDKSNVGSSYYVQQYDYALGHHVREVVSDSESKTANVFVADRNAKLTDISVFTTTPNTEASYEIYLLRSKYRDPYDGVKIQSGEGYSFEYGGYHRFTLKEPVNLFRGQAYSVVLSQKTPSGKSVFSIVCGEKRGTDKEPRLDFVEEAPQEDVPEGSTEAAAQEEVQEGNAEEAAREDVPEGSTEEIIPEDASEEAPEGATEESPEETEEDSQPEEWTEFIVNRKESYILKDGKWLDLTAKEAYDVILGSGKKYVGDPDVYDNLPIKAYLEDAEQAAYPDPAADITVGSMEGSNSKQVLFKLKGRVEEWDTNPVFTWTSSDTGIFTVETIDPEEGVMKITGISPGTAYLMISSEEMGTRVVGVTVE